MSIKKQYLKSKSICKVSFRIDKELAQNAESAHVLGDFNDWQPIHPMRKLKSGEFTTTVELEIGKDYSFRYLIDENKWVNEEAADKNLAAGIGNAENSVICI